MGRKSPINRDRDDRARQMLAQEAARIIVDQGIRDYRVAKTKAAERLDMRDRGSLPGNAEIEQAVSEHLRLFAGDSHLDLLRLMRSAALSAYSVEFYRQERLGLWIKQLKPEEHFGVKHRTDPFSVKMDVRTESHDFSQIVFVAGRNNDRMRCKWRRALLPGGTPPTNDYDPAMAVSFGRSYSKCSCSWHS